MNALTRNRDLGPANAPTTRPADPEGTGTRLPCRVMRPRRFALTFDPKAYARETDAVFDEAGAGPVAGVRDAAAADWAARRRATGASCSLPGYRSRATAR